MLSSVCWCSQHWCRSWTQYCTYSHHSLCATQFRSYSLSLLYPHTDQPWQSCLPPAEHCICHLCISQIFDSLPVSLLEASGTLSLSLEGTGLPAVLTSEALWVTTSLGAVALCYHIYALPIAFKSFHLTNTSSCTCIIQITTIILQYCPNFKVLIYRFQNFLKHI